MQQPAAGNVKTPRALLSRLHAQGNVLLQLAFSAGRAGAGLVRNLPDRPANGESFTRKVMCKRGLIDVDRGHRNRVLEVGERVADCPRFPVPRPRRCRRPWPGPSLPPSRFEHKQLGDLLLRMRAVAANNRDLLPRLSSPFEDAPDGNAPDVVV